MDHQSRFLVNATPNYAGRWTPTEIGGKSVDLYEPPIPSEPRKAVVHLHGHAGTTLKENPYFTAELERHGMYCVCPHGRRSWWLDRVCLEFDETQTPIQYLREQLVPWMAASWNIRPPAIGLSGNSMGGQGVFQLAYRFPREFPVLAAICPAVDFHQWHGRGLTIDEMFPSRETARQQTAILQIHPLNWPRNQLIVCDPSDAEWFDGAERLAMKLSSMGIPFESDFTTSHGGHTWDYVNSMAAPVMKFLAERIDLELRRLPIP